MHRTPWIAALVLPLSLFCAACDSEPVEDRAAVDELVAADAPELEAADAPAAHPHRSPAERLCAKIACSDEQEAEIAALFAAKREAKREGKGGGKPDFSAVKEHNQRLADAFRAGTLGAAELQAHHEALAAARGARGSGPSGLLVELHGLLTPEQRAIVADKLEKRGLAIFGKKHGKKHGKHGKMHGDKRSGEPGDQGHTWSEAPADRPVGDRDSGDRRDPSVWMAKRLDKLCGKVECTEDQRQTLEAKARANLEAGQGAREADRAADKAAKSALAAAFRGDGFSAADVSRFKESHEASHQAKRQGMEAMLLDLQEVLSPEQRAIFAEKLAKKGPGALFGHGKHGKKHGKHGKKHGKHGKKHGKHGKKHVEAMGA